MQEKLKIKTIVGGELENNSYIIYLKKQEQAEQQSNTMNLDPTNCVVVDPASSGKQIIRFLKKENLKVELILLTHGHFDHIEGLNALREFSKAAVAISEDDASMISDSKRNLQKFINDQEVIIAPPEKQLKSGEKFQAAGIDFLAIHTPGHTKGGMCFVVGENIITGDTLFWNDVGRTDLPSGNVNELHESISKLFDQKGDYMCYPGHGPTTTLEHERQHNAFFKNYRHK